MVYEHMLKKLLGFITQTLIDVIGIARSPDRSLRSLYHVSLYRNAVYLMISSLFQAATGIVFWIVATRLYSEEQVGLGSAAIAAVGLLATLSSIGLDFAIIRFLPSAGDRSRDMINSCITVGGLISLFLGVIFIVGLGFWSPALLPIRENWSFITIFLVSTSASGLASFIREIFVAKRRTGFAFAQGTLFSLSRFIPLVVLASFFEDFGIFTAWGIAFSLSVIVSIFFFIRSVEPSYYPMLVVRKESLSGLFRFSSANYVANLFWYAPGFVLPLLVINLLDSEHNAYFYICWTISTILFMIPTAISLSLFAEGAHDQKRLMQEVTRSFKLISLLLVPLVLLVLVLGDKLLLVFGEAYSENAVWLLRILAISAFPLSINFIYFSMKRVQMNMSEVVALSLAIAIVTLGLSYILLPSIGINGVGIAWLASQSAGAVVVGYRLLR